MRSFFLGANQSPNLIIWKERFYSNPSHQWIVSNRYIRSNVEDLLDRVAEKYLSFLTAKDLYLVLSQGKWASSMRSSERVVIVYPDLLKYLESGTTEIGGAILAHELGHLYYCHSEKKIDPLEAQVQADDFAFSLGHGNDLNSFLENQMNNEEMMIRRTYLTAKILSKEIT